MPNRPHTHGLKDTSAVESNHLLIAAFCAESPGTWNQAKPAMVGPVAAENPGAETIRKVLEHVRRIWFAPPDNCAALRSAALDIFRSSDSQTTRAVLNGGMAIAAYPFVGSVGEAFGRLLNLQPEARRTDIQRRLREQYGDRDFVSRITRYDISSFLDWGVVAEGKKSGIYLSGTKIHVRNADQIAWLAEAALISRHEVQIRLSKLRRHPILFQFAIETVDSSILRHNPRLKISRQDLYEEVVCLEPATSQPRTHG